MENPKQHLPARPAHPRAQKLSRDTVFLVGDLLPLCDIVGVLLAAYLAALVYAQWFFPGATPAAVLADSGRAALAASLLAPFILCDRAYVAFASGGHTSALIRCYVTRFLMFAVVVAAIGLASHSLASLPPAWLLIWFGGSLLLTAITRLLLVANLRRLERNGSLTEAIAVVGAGPVADRLIRHLRQTRGDSVEILGVFDDRQGWRECGERHDCMDAGDRATHGAVAEEAGAADRQGWRECGERQEAGAADDPRGSETCANPPTGSIEDLIELGKAREMDWILLTHASSDEGTLQSIVHRLKALAVPVGLCPQDIGLTTPCQVVRYVGDGLPVTLLADRPRTDLDSALAAVEAVVPRWILTLLMLPLGLLRLLLNPLRRQTAPAAEVDRSTSPSLNCPVDNYDLDRFAALAARFGQERYGYVVTPNADHLIRLHRESSFRALYADASYVLLDSRFIAKLLRWTRKQELPVCTGSDLTAKLFGEVIRPDDGLVLIGGSSGQAARLSQRYGLKQLAHFNPPMGFIRDPAAVETCLRFVETHSPFRYCFLAVGAPQQELLAQALKARGHARGMALCVGGSINFLTGEEQRAPKWMQRSGMEWLFRLLQAPGRMAGRYLLRGPKLFGLLRHTDMTLRAAIDLPQIVAPVLAMPQRAAKTPRRKRIAAPRATRGAEVRRAAAVYASAPAP